MYTHVPVLLEEVLAALRIRSDGRYVDATFGRGGHSGAIVERLGQTGLLVAIDRDPQALAAGRLKFAEDARVRFVHGAFGQLAKLVREAGVSGEFDGILLDLGVSSPQLDDAARGFSFSHDGPLDMRMDNSRGITAAQWLAKVSERELARVLNVYGEERYARIIARALVSRRKERPIETTADLASIVSESVPGYEPGKHPATRTFQAIRIAINSELEELEQALKQTLALLAPGGRLCVISFHSLEDGLVKRFMQDNSRDDPMYAGLPEVPVHARARLKRVGKAVHASAQETARNPRARSAVLRVAERLAA